MEAGEEINDYIRINEKFTWLPCEYYHEFSDDKSMQIVYRMFYTRISFHLDCESIVNAYANWKFVENSFHKEYMDMVSRLEMAVNKQKQSNNLRVSFFFQVNGIYLYNQTCVNKHVSF